MSQKVYIKDNLNYIEGLLKSYHKENEIIYVISDKIDLGGVKSDYPLYLVDSCYSDGRRSLRSLFDSNVDLQRFCINNFDENKRYQNMVLHLQHENRILEVDAYRYELILKIDNMDVKQITIPTEIIIYGAGNIGKRFYKKVKNECKVLFFVDGNPKEDFFEDIPIIGYKDFDGKNYANIPVIVTPCYEYEKIKRESVKKYGEINLLPITAFFN